MLWISSIIIFIFLAIIGTVSIHSHYPQIIITVYRKPGMKWLNDQDWTIWSGDSYPLRRKIKISAKERDNCSTYQIRRYLSRRAEGKIFLDIGNPSTDCNNSMQYDYDTVNANTAWVEFDMSGAKIEATNLPHAL